MTRVDSQRLVVGALVLVGCGAMGPAPAPRAAIIVYACPDGQKIRATYPDTRTAVIEYRGASHRLKTALSADGARYIGDGLQWWTKGMSHGSIADLGHGETSAPPGQDCVATADSPASAP